MSLAAMAFFGVTTLCPLDPEHWLHGIHGAARHGHAVRVRLMLALRPDLVNAEARSGKGVYPSPVHFAAERNHVAALAVLIAHGGDVNDRGKARGTPLQLAARWGSVDAADLLLKHGATLDIFSAAALDKREHIDGLLRLADGFGLAKRLANVSAPGPLWSTAPLLNWAVTAGHLRMVELLIGYGADVNPFPSPSEAWEDSPLHAAAIADRPEIAALLLKHGAKPEAKDYDGFTALHRAAACGSVRVAAVLVKHGARLDNREDFHATRISDNAFRDQLSRDTILHTAVTGHSLRTAEVVALLLASGADVNATNAAGQTPLDLAVEESNDPPNFSRGEHARQWAGDNATTIKLLHRYGGKRNPPRPPPVPEAKGLVPAGTPTGDPDAPVPNP